MNNGNFLNDRLISKKSLIFYAVWLLVLAIIQPTAGMWIKIFGVSPDLFIIFVICTGLFRGKREGAVIGFVFGFVFDMLIGRMIGVSAVIYMYLGFLTGLLRERFVSDGCVACAIVIFVAALIWNLIYYIGYCLMWGDISFGVAVIRTILPKALYTGFAGLVLSIPVNKSFEIINRGDFV